MQHGKTDIFSKEKMATFQMADMNIKKMLNITNKPGNASKNTIPFTLSLPKIKNLGITLTKCV